MHKMSLLMSALVVVPLLASGQTVGAVQTSTDANSAVRGVDPAGAQDAPLPDPTVGDSDANVNARYLIESVSLKKNPSKKLSNSLMADVGKLPGQHLDHALLEKLASRMKEELHVPNVEVKVSKGEMPEQVVVTFDVEEHQVRFDLDVSRFLYQSKQGWTGEGNFTIHPHGNAITFGLVSDGDRLAERYAGIQAAFERKNIGSTRFGLRFRFASYHEQWNQATVAMADPSELYRSRQDFMPEGTFVIFEPLQLSFGVDFARYRVPLLNPVALGSGFIQAGERTASSNAVVSTLRYHQRWGAVKDRDQQEWTASYAIRSGTGVLESDALFTKQQGDAQYRLKRGSSEVKIGFHSGRITGIAPIYERFIVGNAETLRGWNKFDIAPLGATHLLHGSIDYTYDGFLIFYDTGAVWSVPSERIQRQSLGVGFKADGFELAVAFPVRAGHANPVFYVGMNF